MAPIIESTLICTIYSFARLIYGTVILSMVIVAIYFPLLHLHNSMWSAVVTIQSGFSYALAFECFRIITNSLNATAVITTIHSIHNLLVPYLAKTFLQLTFVTAKYNSRSAYDHRICINDSKK